MSSYPLNMSLLTGLSFVLLVAVASADVLNVHRIIEEVNSKQNQWVAGHNYDPSTPISYFKRLMGALKRDPKDKTLPVKTYDNYDDIPAEFDARKNWPKCPISHIRDQGNCGSCWAVGAAGALTDRVCIASGGKFTTSLSSDEITACCLHCGMGCDGGYPDSAWKYFKINGLVTGGDYNSKVGCQPYSLPPCEHHTTGQRKNCDDLPSVDPQCNKKCTNKKYHKKSFSEDHHKVSEVYSLESVKDAQRDIMTYGSIEATFEVYEDFPTYKSGVYHHTTGSYLGGHAVRIIGWGTENGVDYWLVANSWNTDWGDKGFFKIRRGTDECKIESDLVAGTI